MAYVLILKTIRKDLSIFMAFILSVNRFREIIMTDFYTGLLFGVILMGILMTWWFER